MADPAAGYAAVGARAGRIAHRAGLIRDDRFGYPAALLAAGFDPDATRPVMEPWLPARVAVARMLVSFLDEMEAAWDGTVTTSTSSSCTTSGSRSGGVALRSSCSATSYRPHWSPG